MKIKESLNNVDRKSEYVCGKNSVSVKKFVIVNFWVFRYKPFYEASITPTIY